MLLAVEDYYISGYADGGDAPDKPLELAPGASEDTAKFLERHAETRARFDKVADLVAGFETPFGLELLSTVHWVIAQEPVECLDDVVAQTYAWNDRKKQFSPRQIALAVDVLSRKAWVEPALSAEPATRAT